MRHGSAVTGKRRIAFAAYVDEDRLPRLLVLLRSLALSNPRVCEDFLLLHPGLADAAFDPARRLHPRLVPCKNAGGEGSAVRDLTALPGDGAYDTVITLDTDTPVERDISELLRAREPVVSFERAAEYGAPARAPRAGAAGGARATDRDFRAAYCALPGRKHPDLLLHCGLPLLAEAGEAGGTGEAGETGDAGGAGGIDVPALARTVGLALHQQGRYREAVEILTPAAGDPGRARLQEALGSALMAVSRYDEATTRLLLATADPAVAPRAYVQLTRLAWLRGEDETAHAYARQGLDAEPTDREARTLYRRTLPAAPAPEWAGPGEHAAPAAEQVAHVALFATGQANAGDKVLPEAVRRCFGAETGPRRWHTVPVHRLVTESVLEQLNARRGVIVGGGGLFLPDTWPNGNSGWQWNVPDAMLRRITPPLAVFGVGYNIFDGQQYARERMSAALRALAEQSAFFGLRNRGSVERVRELLPEELRDRVRYQPCPTTVLRHLLPGWRDPGPGERSDVILLNCAYDRAGLRFGHDYGHFLAQLARAVTRLGDHAEVRYAAHAPSDERFVRDLRREHGMTLPVDTLYDLDNDELAAHYRQVKLVLGMRGHATMIPFGCGTPALSLISHPKLAYFLADVDRPEWGVSVHADDLGEQLTERAVHLLEEHDAAVADVHDRQQALLDITRENSTELADLFGLPAGEAERAAGAVGGPRLSAAGEVASR